ncbi:MAG: hypothetical protein VX893_12245, partial [Candidatus Latescibacterota bacterium]|nr:hypothetical protein [Candidatus Latescibacterota bacterium]
MPRAQYFGADVLSVEKEIPRHESVGRQTAQRVGKGECCAKKDAGKPSAQGGEFKKVVGPSQKKAAIAYVMDHQLFSMRRACNYLSLPRSTYRYTPKPLTDRQQQLHQRIEP